MIVGFAVDILVAARFRLGQLTDAYFLATTIPVALLAIVASSNQSILVTAFARSKSSLDVVTVVTLLLDWPMIHWFGASGLGFSFIIGVLVALFVGLRLVHVDDKLFSPLV